MSNISRIPETSLDTLSAGAMEVIRHLCESECHTFADVLQWCETRGDCVYAVQRHFVDCVLNDRPFESTIDDYLKSVRLVEAAYESAATNQVVRIAS